MTLLDAFAAVRKRVPGARLVIVGDGPERQRLEARAAQDDLAGSVQITGYRSDVRALLPAADVYASSSISEGVSITILEAMAAGMPVVATAVGGTPEILSDGTGGIAGAEPRPGADWPPRSSGARRGPSPPRRARRQRRGAASKRRSRSTAWSAITRGSYRGLAG